MNEFTIRHAQETDLNEICRIYASARAFMAAHGNPHQWGDNHWPPESLIKDDITSNKSYVCLKNDMICGVFYFDYGEDIDPTYRVINGAWKDFSAYGAVHRIASSHQVKGAGSFCINWAFDHCGHLRMDTHPDNIVMQNLLTKLGFVYCGTIHVKQDNMPRLAYEKWRK